MPRACIAPQRVPQGLHGTWIPKAWSFWMLASPSAANSPAFCA